MLKLSAIKMDKVWGYELWIASTHPNGPQKEFVDFCGGPYPLLVKVIQADQSLSVQVHPDDETAALLEGSGNVGKTECWYVLASKPGAKLVYGLNGNPSRESVAEAIEKNALDPLLNQVEVRAGDFVFIPSGTVHAIGGGLRLMEVQQSCDITHRLYDWGAFKRASLRSRTKALRKSRASRAALTASIFRWKKSMLRARRAWLTALKTRSLFTSLKEAEASAPKTSRPRTFSRWLPAKKPRSKAKAPAF